MSPFWRPSALVSRLPQLLSPDLLLDGDEAILGLMAKHIADGTAFPMFLYGQNYGLAAVEVAAGASSFLVAGIGALQLKLALLALWTIGIVAYFPRYPAWWGTTGASGSRWSSS